MSSAAPRAQRQLVVAEDDLDAKLALARDELAKAEAMVAEWKAQIAKLETVRSLLDDPDFQQEYAVRRSGGPQQKDMILEVLQDAAGDAMSVRAIRAAIKAKHGRSVERTSVSPVLTKLESAGVVEHVGSAWRMRDA